MHTGSLSLFGSHAVLYFANRFFLRLYAKDDVNPIRGYLLKLVVIGWIGDIASPGRTLETSLFASQMEMALGYVYLLTVVCVKAESGPTSIVTVPPPERLISS